MFGWLVGFMFYLVGLLVCYLVSCLVGWLVIWFVDYVVFWLFGLAVWLFGLLVIWLVGLFVSWLVSYVKNVPSLPHTPTVSNSRRCNSVPIILQFVQCG